MILITFSERFTLPVQEVFSYLASLTDWARLYGFVGVRDLGSGWFAIGLAGLPFPLARENGLSVTDFRPASRHPLPAVRAGEISKLSPVFPSRQRVNATLWGGSPRLDPCQSSL